MSTSTSLEQLLSFLEKQNPFLFKDGPPRPGLVPKSGDYQHPDRWVRPEEAPKVSEELARIQSTKIGSTDTHKLAIGIRRALQERPSRFTHGNTGKNAFWLLPNGEIIAWDQWQRGQKAIMGHSHLPENWNMLSSTEREQTQQPHNSGDLEVLQRAVRQGYGDTSILITGDNTFEILYVPDNAKERFSKLSKRQLKQWEPTYDEVKKLFAQGSVKTTPDAERLVLREYAKAYGLVYLADIPWKENITTVHKEDSGGNNGVGTVATSTNSGIFTPTFGGDTKRRKPHFSALNELVKWVERAENKLVVENDGEKEKEVSEEILEKEELASIPTTEGSPEVLREQHVLDRKSIQKHLHGEHDQKEHGGGVVAQGRIWANPNFDKEARDYQEGVLERTVKSSSWGGGAGGANVRFRLENLGDALREIVGNGAEDYIEEKLARVERSLNDSEWKAPLDEQSQGMLILMQRQLENFPAKSERAKLAQQLMMAGVRRDLSKIKQLIDKVRILYPSKQTVSKSRPGLVPKRVQVNRSGKTFQAIRWVNPNIESVSEESQVREDWEDIRIYDQKLSELPHRPLWSFIGSERQWTSDWHSRDRTAELSSPEDRKAAIEYVLAHEFGNEFLDDIKDIQQQYQVQINILPPRYTDLGIEQGEYLDTDVEIHAKMPVSKGTSSAQIVLSPKEVDFWDADDLASFQEEGEDGEAIQRKIFDSTVQTYSAMYGEPDFTKWKSGVGYFQNFIDEKLGKEPKAITVYRDMSPKEYDAWSGGDKIPTGKYFATNRGYAKGADIGYDPESQVYSFRVPSNMLVPDGSGGWQLRSDAILDPTTRRITTATEKISKSYARDKCMHGSEPPTTEILWAEGMAHAWFCDKHLEEFKKKNPGEISSLRKLPYGVASKHWKEGVPTKEKAEELKLEKLQPPRPGLVPQSGDWNAPDRWIRPEGTSTSKLDQANQFVRAYKEKESSLKSFHEVSIAVGKLFKNIMGLGFTLEEASEIIDPEAYKLMVEQRAESSRRAEVERGKIKEQWGALDLQSRLEGDEERLVAQAQEWGKQVFGNWQDHLIQGQLEAFDNYLTNGYRKLNTSLRRGQEPKEVKALDAALEKAVIENPIVVYRGVSDPKLGNLVPGEEFTDKAFISTSLLPQVAMRAGELEGKRVAVLYEIHLPSKVHAAYTGGLIPEAEEAEVLIKRGQRFKIKSITKKELIDKDREETREYTVVKVEAIV